MGKMEKEFEDWLNKNKYGYYKGFEIKPETKLVAYTFVVSAIVITHRSTTRYYFKEVEKGKAKAAKLFSSLGTLIFGWWGIPWGPIWTIQAVGKNLMDSDEVLWGSLAGVKEGEYEWNDSQTPAPAAVDLQRTEKQKGRIWMGIIIAVIILFIAMPFLQFLFYFVANLFI